MDLAYIAHSERCALLLDRDGICRWLVPKVDASDETVTAARRCVGAQFVASLDPNVSGFISGEPRTGASLLFAVVTGGRVTLLRFGPLCSFEKLDSPNEAQAIEPEPAQPETPKSKTVADPAVTLDGRATKASEPTLKSADAVAAEAVAAETDAVEPMPPTLSRVPDLDDVLASFSEEPVEHPHHRDALAPTERAPRLAALPPQPEDEPGDSQLDVVTTAFLRPSTMPEPAPGRDATPQQDARGDEDLEDELTAAPRPSGFVKRAAASAESDVEEDATRRFLRASGDSEGRADLFDLGRRGMLPRR